MQSKHWSVDNINYVDKTYQSRQTVLFTVLQWQFNVINNHLQLSAWLIWALLFSVISNSEDVLPKRIWQWRSDVSVNDAVEVEMVTRMIDNQHGQLVSRWRKVFTVYIIQVLSHLTQAWLLTGWHWKNKHAWLQSQQNWLKWPQYYIKCNKYKYLNCISHTTVSTLAVSVEEEKQNKIVADLWNEVHRSS